MKKIFLFTLILVAIPQYNAAENQIPSEEIESIERINCWNLTYKEEKPHPEFEVCDTTLQNEPKWEGPESSDPPLSIHEAVLISRKQLGCYEDPNLDWKVIESSLKQLLPKKWVYLITWIAFNAHDYKERVLKIPVLMSGNPVKGKQKKPKSRI